MSPRRARVLGGLPLLALVLLAACGDDLESRNAAVGGNAPGAGGITVQSRPSAPSGNSTATSDDEAEQDEDTVQVDADADSLMDSAQGFGAAPMDTAAGFDPTPTREPAFGTAPTEPESFGD